VRDVIARSDLYERAGKDHHAFCLRVGRSGRSYPYDVRVLADASTLECNRELQGAATRARWLRAGAAPPR
jgi:hypothetical protein